MCNEAKNYQRLLTVPLEEQGNKSDLIDESMCPKLQKMYLFLRVICVICYNIDPSFILLRITTGVGKT